VTSHGWNDPRKERHHLWREFDWQGTLDPTAFLALPAAIRLVGGLHPDGWPGVMAANRALALESRRRIEATIEVESLAPESMVASFATARVPAIKSENDAQAAMRAFHDESHIEIPFPEWPVRAARERADDPPRHVLVRVSAQLYNEPADVDRLLAEMTRRGLAGGSQASAIVSG
jgi:isopenicillin-N epimerase